MSKYNFGKRHWMNILLCFFLFVLNNACMADGENVILPRLSALNGWDYSNVLMVAALAGILGVGGQLLMGKVCEKKGPKFTIILSLLLTAGFLMMYGSARYMWVYAVGLLGTACFAPSFSYMGGNVLITNWFPRKKGLAMGFVSMGSPVSTIIMVSLLTLLMTALGVSRGVMVICIVLIVVAVICIFTVYDKPEMCGETPDNMSREELTKLHEEEEQTEVIPMKSLLQMKETWYIIIICGICALGLVGVMAQFIVRYTNSGFAEGQAILMMSICAAIGIFGSALVGNVENRLGTIKAYSIFCLIFIAALLLNFTNIKLLVFLSIPLFGCVITIIQIFLTAFEMTVFGRTNFKQANSIIYPASHTIGQLAFVIISICIKVFGEVRYAYLVFAALFLISLFFNRKLKAEIHKG